MMVVEVLITSCQVSLKPKNGPLTAQDDHRRGCHQERDRLAGDVRHPARSAFEN